MSNTREITSITMIWTPSGEKQAKYLALTNFYDYYFNGGGGMVNYRLIGMQDNGTSIDADGNTIQNPVTYVDLYESRMPIPANIVQQWGASDEIIFNYVAQQLNITIAPSV
jgi:hypothetical protein